MLNKNACSNPYSVWPQKKVCLFFASKDVFHSLITSYAKLSIITAFNFKIRQRIILFFGEK